MTSSLPVHSSFLSQDDSVKVSVSPKTEVYVDDGHVYTVVEVTLDKNPLIVRSHDGSVHIHFEPTADYFKFDQNPKAYYGFDGYIKRSDGTYAKQTVGGNGRNNNQGDGFDYTWSFWNSAVNQYDRLVFKVGIILKNGYEDYIDKSGKLEIPFKVNGEVIQNDVGTHNYISLGAGYIQFHVSKPVVVKYVDEDGNDIYKSQTITGKYGDTYDASTKQYMPDIDGYTLDKDKLPSNQVGIISDQDQVVTYVYKRDVVSGGNVTFKYQDENGKKLMKILLRAVMSVISTNHIFMIFRDILLIMTKYRQMILDGLQSKSKRSFMYIKRLRSRLRQPPQQLLEQLLFIS